MGISPFRPVVASYGVGPLGCDPLTVNPAIRAGKNPNPLGLGVRQFIRQIDSKFVRKKIGKTKNRSQSLSVSIAALILWKLPH